MMRLLSIAASLRLTFPAMLALVVGVLVSYRGGFDSHWWVSAPLLVLAVNLAAALVVHPRFRRQPGLLCFHLALLAVLVLGATEQGLSPGSLLGGLRSQSHPPQNPQPRQPGRAGR
jgi:cytochrome c biogenesis protein